MKSLAKTSFYCVIGILIGLTFFVGCKDDDTSNALSLTPKRLVFTQKSTGGSVTVNSNNHWKTLSSASWCTVSPTSSNSGSTAMTVTVAENTSSESRTAYVVVAGISGRDTVKILQTGNVPMIALYPLTSTSISRSGTTLTVMVASNVGDWEISTNDGWILLPTLSSGTQTCALTILTNSYLERTGTVRFKHKYGNVYADLKIKQAEGANLERGADSMVLVNLYKKLSGDKWTSDKQWPFIQPMTTWKGVTLTNQRVTELSLNNGNLQGELPIEIAGLTNLKTLSLIGNKLSGNVPTALSQLNLEELSLGGNLYSGSIPGVIASISSLKKLDLSKNTFNGNIPDLSSLKNLEYLSLSDNQLSGNIPNTLGNLNKLQTLYLDNNRLSGNIPSSMGNIKELKELRLFSNTLSGNIPETLGNLTNLTRLDLNNNKLSGSIPESLGYLTKLVRLFLNNNQLTGSIPATFKSFVSLENLSLANNQLTGAIPSGLGDLVKLENLLLNKNQLSGNIPSELGKLTGLMTLNLSDNDLNGSIPLEIEKIKGLMFLYLSGNKLSGSIPESFLNRPEFFCPQQSGYNFDNCNCQN